MKELGQKETTSGKEKLIRPFFTESKPIENDEGT
jgi:hypothetical protein